MTEPARPSPEREVLRALGRLLRVPAGLAAWAFVLLLAAFYIRSGANADAAAASPALSARFEALTGNAVSQALEELAYIPKIYRIPPGSQAPAPRESGFGTAADAQEVLQLLQTAARRLGGDGVTAWSPDRSFWPVPRWNITQMIPFWCWYGRRCGTGRCAPSAKCSSPTDPRSGGSWRETPTAPGILQTATELL